MSADEWRTCPFCEKEKERLKSLLTVVEYEKKMKDFLHPEYGTEETIAIYHDFGFNDDGIFSLDYGADCAVCGAEWNFKIKPTKPTEEGKFALYESKDDNNVEGEEKDGTQ